MERDWEREGEVRGCETVCMCLWVCECGCVCTCVDAGEEEQSEICNALLNEVVYCYNVSCIAL